jgi:putative endonuclease
MNYHVYLLELCDGDYYSGSTSNLENRIKQHQNGQNPSTKDKRPIKLVWCATFRSKKLAQEFEKYLKGSSGFAFRNKRLI